MSFSFTWAFVFHAPESDPVKDRYVLDRGGFRSLMVPVPNLDTAVTTIKDLVNHQGVQSIELCGYFGVTGAARVVAAVEGKVPVGSVAFAAESVAQAAKAFFPPTA